MSVCNKQKIFIGITTILIIKPTYIKCQLCIMHFEKYQDALTVVRENIGTWKKI